MLPAMDSRKAFRPWKRSESQSLSARTRRESSRVSSKNTWPSIGSALSWLGARFMSVYLWHMPALIVVAGVTVYGLGYATPVLGSVLWLVMAPAWVAACAFVLLVLLRLFGHFEIQRENTDVTAKVPQLVVAGLLASAGLLGLAAHGFAPLSDGIGHGPVPWVVLATSGFVLAGKQIQVAEWGTRLLGKAVLTAERARGPVRR